MTGAVAIGPAPGPVAKWLWLAAVVAATLVFVTYWPTWQSMLQVWEVPTYSHGYVIPFASAWLIWRQQSELKGLPVQPGWSALLLIAGAGALWLLGELASVNTPRHFAVVIMLISLVPLFAGWAITRKLTFPLLFVFFAVPFGEFMVEPMMDWTASVTIWMVSAVGVPIYREGLNFVLPSGSWQVVEECSGQRYLIAAMPLACIFAYLTYRRNRTRFLFLLFTTLVALAANWLRAFGIVMIGHHSGMTLATGVDHLVYGWLFFGVVMALVFWFGSYWTEKPLAETASQDADAIGHKPTTVRTVITCLVTGIASILVWSAIAGFLYTRPGTELNLTSALDGLGATRKVLPFTEEGIDPPFSGMSDQVAITMTSGGVDGVSAWVGSFEQQRSGAEMIGHGQGLKSGRDNGWNIATVQTVASPLPALAATEYELARGSTRVLIWQSYLVADTALTSKSRTKLMTAWQILSGKGDRSMVAMVWKTIGKDRAQDQLALHKAMSEVHSALLKQRKK